MLRDTDGAQALAALGVERLNRALAAIVSAQEALLANVNPTLAIERLLIALKRQERRAPSGHRTRRSPLGVSLAARLSSQPSACEDASPPSIRRRIVDAMSA